VFQDLINNAKSAASGLVLKYLARASVAVPFIIGLGFALAAITVMLIDRFGHVTAYWAVAGGLAVVGALASVIVSATGRLAFGVAQTDGPMAMWRRESWIAM
jgi:hypothetical protein